MKLLLLMLLSVMILSSGIRFINSVRRGHGEASARHLLDTLLPLLGFLVALLAL